MSYLKYIDYGESHAPLKVISLHGFPSVRSKQNRELAQGIASALNCRARVILYPGLSTEGLFSFKKTIEALENDFLTLISDASGKVDLLGHSFGGFCAILLAAKYPQKIRRVVLLSPLLQFNSSVSDVTEFFVNILGASQKAGLNTLSPADLGYEFHELSKKYSVENLISKLDPDLKLKLMQAKVDNVTPTTIAENFRRFFKCKFEYEVVDQDHSFLVDRTKLAKEIANFFK